MSNTLNSYLFAQETTRRRRAESEAAAAHLELARRDELAAMLVSQEEPVHTLGIDRNALQAVLAFLVHGDQHRLVRDAAALRGRA